MAIDLEAVPYAWVRRELELPSVLSRGSRGKRVRALQEWLGLHRVGTGIDGDFGPATEFAVRTFQSKAGLPVTGSVDPATWEALVAPLLAALKPVSSRGKGLPELVTAFARQHLKQSPREIGGENCGPWVRVYTGGHDGRDWAWCAGFVTFLIRQAADALDRSMPIKGSVSCDTLAMQAREAGLFVAERDARRTPMPEGSIFLNRRTATDWTHTGVVTRFGAEAFDTIEGNTNDEGAREGYEVCARARGYGSRDFISFAGCGA